jgi:putative lipoic acid-binding regulatory protein
MTKPESALDALHTEERESALTFPCVFPIKIMGRTQDGFRPGGIRRRAQARA